MPLIDMTGLDWFNGLPREYRTCAECGKLIEDKALLLVVGAGVPASETRLMLHHICAARLAADLLTTAVQSDGTPRYDRRLFTIGMQTRNRN